MDARTETKLARIRDLLDEGIRYIAWEKVGGAWPTERLKIVQALADERWTVADTGYSLWCGGRQEG